MLINNHTGKENHTGRQILFVDPGVNGAAALLESVSPDTDIIHLQPGTPALAQMATALKQQSDVGEIHLLAHGEPGALSLAGTAVDAAALAADPSSLSVISAALGKGAKLALWACSVGAGAVGRTFTKALEAATGAHVFAANGLVGAAAKGGSWDIGTNAPFSQPAMAAYGHTLPTFDGGGNVSGLIYTEADNGDGITLTIDFSDFSGFAPAVNGSLNGGGIGGSTGFVIVVDLLDVVNTVTVSFSSAVTVNSFVHFDTNRDESGTYTFTPTGGSGSTINVDATAFINGGTTVNPADWDNVTGFTVTSSDGAFSPGFDTIDYTVYTAPSQPTAPPIDYTPVFNDGSGEDDDISGAGGNDTLIGGTGNDIVRGAQGDDQIWAGAGDEGNDTIDGGSGEDTIGGGAGDDFIEGGDGADTLFGGAGDDIIYTTEKDNENGDFSTNTAWGGMGNDTLFGGFGSDALGGGLGADALQGGRGADILYGGRGDDDLNGGTGADTVFGGADNDTLNGGAGNDLLYNGAGDDTVDGSSGDDILWGGGGNDTLTGGEGADIFSFTASSSNDTITDFNTGEDQLNLSELGFAAGFDLASIASETTSGETAGILLELAEDTTVFLAGLSLTDLSSINVTV